MFAIRSTRSENNASHGDLSSHNRSYSKDKLDCAGAVFTHFPALQNLFDVPLFTHLDRGIGTRVNL
jgi:hypothetical protein